MIRAEPVLVNPFTVGRILDNDLFQCSLLHGVEFPAQRWRTISRRILQRGGELHQEFYRWARRDFFKKSAASYSSAYDVWKKLQPETLP